jgi:enamine deaminase RidA (YjgF/YER057c/UK114 family)
MAALRHYQAPDGMTPGAGYSHAVTGRGRWVAIAGQVALDAAGNLAGPGDPWAQARQAFANLGHALAAAGASFADVVKLNYYLTDITMLSAVRAVRDEHIDTAWPPASTAVQVTALFRPEFLIEVEAWALCDE